MLSINERTYQHAAHSVLGIIGIIILFTFRHYGISWDEEIQSQYGQAIYDYYNSGLVDHRYDDIFNLHLYGGMFDGLAALFDAYSPMSLYSTRHLLNALFGLAGLWGTWKLGRIIGGAQVGFTALLLLALTPMYYGHMFNNPKDIPFAAGVVWTLYYMAKSLRAFPNMSPRLIVKLGLMLGLTLGIRVGGVMIIGYWGLVMLFQAASNPQELVKRNWGRVGMSLIKLFAPVLLIAYAVMLVCWPWAQESPVINPIKALIEFSNFPQNVEVLLNGTTYMSTELPWFYLPLYFGVQLPVPHLLLIIAGLGLLPFLWMDLRMDLRTTAQRHMLLLLLLMAFVPMLYAVTHQPALYDAVRHFIFTLPLMCILAALAYQYVLKFAQLQLLRLHAPQTQRFIRIGLVGVICLGIVFHITTMVRLHPYEYIYVNQLQGGVQGAYGKYELDYWGSSFKEAAQRLQEYVAKEGGVPAGKIYKIAICGPWDSAMMYLPPDYEAVIANEPADFFLSTTRWMCQNMRPGKEIIRIDRMGVPLSLIKDLQSPLP